MNERLRKILPYLLRPADILTSLEIGEIKEVYQSLGRDIFEKEFEKQTRCYASLTFASIDCDSEYWKSIHEEYVKRNTAILEIVKEVSKDFYDAGGKTLSVYENYGAVLSSGISIGCFASGDVDFTVSEDELDLAKSVFANNGFLLDDRKDHAAVSQNLVLPFYNPTALGKGYWLNIMRKPVARDLMLDQSKTLQRLHSFQDSGFERYNDTEVRLLSPTAMVYFNALHFASEHYYSASPGMALCCDVDRIIRNRDIEWQELIRWADEDNVGLRIQLTLDICKYFLHTHIPDNLFPSKSNIYHKLWQRLVDENKYFLNPQIGRYSRLVVELLSDDKPLLASMVSRYIKK